MDAKTRRDRIEERVRVEREVGYADLATEFDVSEMTIRRDMEHWRPSVSSAASSEARSR